MSVFLVLKSDLNSNRLNQLLMCEKFIALCVGFNKFTLRGVMDFSIVSPPVNFPLMFSFDTFAITHSNTFITHIDGAVCFII